MPTPVLDLRTRKLLRLFEILDVDKDGVVTETDCIDLGRELSFAVASIVNSAREGDLAAAIGSVEQSLQAVQLAGTMTEIWNEYRTRDDVEDNDRLTADDWVTAMVNDLATRPDKVIRLIGILTNLVFEMADIDEDGWISRDESIALGVRVLRVGRGEAVRAWETLDTRNHGRLSYGTMLKAVAVYVTGVDPGAPENLLLGPL